MHRALVGLHFTDEGGEITFGDYNSDLVQGGEQNLIWFMNKEESLWSFDVTQAKLGSLEIFHNSAV